MNETNSLCAIQSPEPRFYPSIVMKVDLDEWRALPSGERMARGLAFSEEIRRLLFARVQELHPTWNHEQHAMMFFRLCYAGEGCDGFAEAKIARGDWTREEVEEVRQTPIPRGREDGACYAAIEHPDLDEEKILWPSAGERGLNT